MNKVIIIGRLTADPAIAYTQGAEPIAVARYTLAADRQKTADGQQAADFIPCVAWRKNAEFAGKYLRKGMKIAVEGRLQSGSYMNKEGKKVYTLDVNVDRHEFCENKGWTSPTQNSAGEPPAQNSTGIDGFLDIPQGMDEELPFK